MKDTRYAAYYTGWKFWACGLLALVFLTSSAHAASWFDANYGIRQPLTVTASTDALSAGYSVSITFDHAALVTAGSSLASGDDVRLVYWNGTANVELDRIIDTASTWNTTTTKVWFKVQTLILASGNDANYYLYYKNPAAVSPPANGSNVYQFWDDFSGSSLDAAKWTTVNAAGNTLTVSGGSVSIASGGDWWTTSDTALYIVGNTSFSYDYVAEVYVQKYGTAAKYDRFVGLRAGTAVNSAFYAILNAASSKAGNVYRDSTGATAGYFEGTVALANNAVVKFVRTGDTVTQYFNGTQTAQRTVSGWGLNYVALTDCVVKDNANPTQFDWVRVRKYVPTDGAITTALGAVSYASTGHVYAADTVTPLNGVTVALAVNGVYNTAAVTDASGAYSITFPAINAEDVLTFYIQGDTSKVVLVTRGTAYAGGAGYLIGMDLYANRLIVRSETSNALTNTNLTTAIGALGADVTDIYTVDGSNNLTVAAVKKLIVWTGKSYSPGANVSTPDNIDVYGTLTLASTSLTISGTLTNVATGTIRLKGDEAISVGTFTQQIGSTVSYIGSGAYASLPLGNTYQSDLIFNGTGSWQHAAQLLTVNGNLTIQAGTLNSAGQSITLAGNWSNSGTYTSGVNTVTLSGTDQTIYGNNTFSTLYKHVTALHSLTFEAGKTQTITGTLDLAGATGQLLQLRSTTTGTQAKIDPQSTRTLAYLDVKDNWNTNATQINATGTNSVDSLGNTNWNIATPATFTWLGTTNTNWNTGSNWQGGVAPSSVQTAIFSGAYNNPCTINVSTSVGGINILVGYKGTITQAPGMTQTVGTSGFTQADGTFSGGNSAISVTGVFTLSGGTFTPTSGTMTLGNNSTFLNTVWSVGTVLFATNANDITITGSQTFNHLTHALYNTKYLTLSTGVVLTVNGTLTFATGTAQGGSGCNGGTINANGNVTATAFGTKGTTNLYLTGSSPQILSSVSGGFFPTLTLNSTSTISLSGTIVLSGDWEYKTGTVDITTYTNTVQTIQSNTFVSNIKGSMIFSNLIIASNNPGSGYYTLIDSATTLTVNGTLTFPVNLGVGGCTCNGGTINANGNVIAGTYGATGTTVLNFTGTGAQNWSSTGGVFPSSTITINKASGTVTLGSAVSVNNSSQNLTLTQGTLDLAGYALTVNSTLSVASGATLQLQGGETVTATTKTFSSGSTVKYNGTAASYTLKNYAYSNLVVNGGSSTVFALPAALTTIKDLTISAGTLDVVNGSNYGLTVSGNWSNSGTFIPQLGTVTLNGSSQTISGTTTFYNLTEDTSSGSAAATLIFQNGTTQTISNTLTLKGNATNSLILVSDSPGTRWKISPNGTRTLSRLSVTDSSNTAPTYIDATSINSTNGGNNLRWFFTFPASTPTWIGDGTNVTEAWNTAANWYGGVPGSGSTAYFDGSVSDDNCNLNGAISITSININSSYTGTIMQGSNTITLSGAYTQAGGTFAGGGSTITLTSTFALSGGTFNAGTQTIKAQSNWTYSGGTFNTGSSTWRFSSGNNTLTGSAAFNNLQFGADVAGGARTFALAAGTTFIANGALTISSTGTGATNVNGTGGVIEAKGAIDLGNQNNDGTATLLIDGTVDQTISSGHTRTTGGTPKININKANGTTLFLPTWLCVTEDWTYTAGVIDSSTSTIVFNSFAPTTSTITGTHTLTNVIIDPNWNNQRTVAIAAGTTLNVSTSLLIDNSSTGSITIGGTGTIAAQGSITFGAENYDGTATLLINGTVDQTMTGSQSRTVGGLPLIDINKTSGTLFLVGVLNTQRNWTHTVGTVDATTNSSTVIFSGINTPTITGSHTLYNVIFDSNNGTTRTYTIASGTTLNVAGTLTIDNTSTAGIAINTGTIAAQGSIVIGGENYDGTATLLINGTVDQTMTGSQSRTVGGLPLVVINKTLGTLTLAGTINTTRNWTYTAGLIDASTNSSTVIFSGINTPVITGSHTLYNIIFDSNSGVSRTFTVAVGTTLTVAGTLTLDNTSTGTIAVNTGTLAAQGDVVTTSDLLVTSTTAITLSGGNNQSINCVNLPNSTFTVNKTGGVATLAANLVANSTGQDLAITAGTLDLEGFNLTVNDLFTIGATGNLQLLGSETISKAPTTISAGGTVTYDGTAASYTLKNYSYSNLVVNGGATTVFSFPASLTTINTLTLTNSITALAGFNLTASTLSNDATLRLQGKETVSITTMDTDSGIVEYVGRNIAEVLTVSDFGASDYFNLKINDTNGTPALFSCGAVAKTINGTFTLASGNFLAPSTTMSVAGNFTHSGGTFTHNSGTVTLTASANHTIAGTTTFNNFTLSAPSTVTFTSGTTQTFVGNFTDNGSVGNLITLNSTVSGSAATLSKASGTVSCDYLSLKDSAATGGAAWNAESHCINVSGNSGWRFMGFNALLLSGD